MATNPLQQRLNLLGSLAATAMRTGMGVLTQPATVQPEQLLELYDFEGCPHCRLVREALTELDLDALILPCPKRGQRFRPKALELGGKAQFPFLVDPNTGTQLYEAADIIAYLYQTYGNRNLPWPWQALELQRVSSMFAVLPRFGAGTYARASTAPEQPLELYSFEASPFARPVRETLCELEISYRLRSVGRNNLSDWLPPALRDSMGVQPRPTTRNRRELLERAERLSIPYLVDANTHTEMDESSRIVAYLETAYAS